MAGLLLPSLARAETLSPGFVDSPVLTGLQSPTAVRFAPAGDPRVFVAQKNGQVLAFSSLSAGSPTLVADLSTQVLNFWDRGLLGLAVDPQFPARPYLYVLYTYDSPIGGLAPRWNDACPSPPGPNTDGCVASGRLSRIQIDPTTNVMIPGSEQTLINDWCSQYSSHSVGDLNFGPDGSLYASGGAGASYLFIDYGQGGGTTGTPGTPGFTPRNPCGDPPVPVGGAQTPPTAEGGSLRSQSFRRSDGPASLGGTVVRVDPGTGDALPTNPAFSQADPNRQRIVAFGLRNPFRFTVRPGTNELWIGDVGENNWEEIDRQANPTGAVINYGWPCYEGASPMAAYQRLNLNQCASLYAAGTAANPYFSYSHANPVVPGDGCLDSSGSSVTGLAFNHGGPYPRAYDGALFFADHTRNCIWALLAPRGGLPDSSRATTVASLAGNPVDLQSGPDGAIYYADLEGGAIHRLGYMTPSASASVSATSGAAPLPVEFVGHASSDPDPTAVLSYRWDFGDGTTASTADAAHSYARPGSYRATLTVTDQRGASDSSTLTITAGATPPTAVISSPVSSLSWAVGDVIAFSGAAQDAVDGALAPSAFSWSLIVHHCPRLASACHTHRIQDFNGVSAGTFAAPDHDYPSYLELRLTVTNASGLQDTQTVDIHPRAVNLTALSSPPGAAIALDSQGAVAPLPIAVIANSTHSVSAPSAFATPQGLYTFRSWSDGGAASHDLTAAGDQTLTAIYDPPTSGPLPTAAANVFAPPPPTAQVLGTAAEAPPRSSPPAVTRCLFSPRRFFTSLATSRHRHSPQATALRCTLSQPAVLVISLRRPRGGRSRSRPAGWTDRSLTVHGATGPNSFAISSWLSRAALAPGRYTAAIRAVDRTGRQASPVLADFTIRGLAR